MKPDLITARQRDLWRAGALLVPLVHAASRCSWVTALTLGLAVAAVNWLLPKYLTAPGKGLRMVQRLWACVVIARLLDWNAACWPSHHRPYGASLVLLALAAWSARGGKGRNAGIGCVLLWPVALLLGAVLLSGMPEVSLPRLTPQWSMPDAWLVVVGLLPLWETGRETPIRGKQILWGLALAVVTAGVVSGVLSPAVSREAEVPVYTLSRSIGMLGAGERMESLTAVAMTLGYYTGAGYLLNGTIEEGENKEKVWLYALISAVIYLTGIGREGRIAAIGSIGIWVILPVLETLKKIFEKTSKST